MHRNREILNQDMGVLPPKQDAQNHGGMGDLDMPEQAAQIHDKTDSVEHRDMPDSPEHSYPLGEREETKSSSIKTKKSPSTTVRKTKRYEPNLSKEKDGDEKRDELKKERSKSKIASSQAREVDERKKNSDEPDVSTKIDEDGNVPKKERSRSRKVSQSGMRRRSISAADVPKISTKTDEIGKEPKRERSTSKKRSSTTVRRTKSSDDPNVSTKNDGDKDRDEPKREHLKSRIASHHTGRRSSMSAVGEQPTTPKSVRRTKTSTEPDVSTKTDENGDEPKRERSKSRIASHHTGRRSSMSAVGEQPTTPKSVRRSKSSDEPDVSAKTAEDGDEPKRERSKSRITSHHTGRRSSMSAVGEPIISTKAAEDGDERPKRERSKSRITSHHTGRRSSMSAVGEPIISTKTDEDGNEPKRDRSKSRIASQHHHHHHTGRRSSMSGVGEPSVKTKTDRDRPEKERSSSRIHVGRRSSMSAVIDNTLKDLECPGFLMGGLVGGRADLVREKSSNTFSSKDSSGRKRSKNRIGSPDKHRSGSPSKQHSPSYSSKQGTRSSRSRSKRPSDWRDNHFEATGFSPSKRGSQSPRSTRTAQTQSSSGSRSQRSESLAPASEEQRKKSQDSIKLLIASLDVDFTDDFKICKSSTSSSALKKSEKARQARIASVDPLDSPETARQARLLASLEPAESTDGDSHRENEIAYWPKRERKPTVAASGTSRTMAIRSSVWTNPARPKVLEIEAPEMHEDLDAQKAGDRRRMSRRMSNPAVAAASTVLARNVASPTEAIKTAITDSGHEPVTRTKHRSHSSQPGGRVRRMSLRASGQGEGDKKQLLMLGAESTGHEAILFVDEKEKSILSPKRSPRKVILNTDLPATPKRQERSTVAPVTPSIKSPKKGSSIKSPTKKSRKSQTAPTTTDLAAKSPKPTKIMKDDDDAASGAPLPSRVPITSKSLKSSLNKLRPSRRASLTGEVDDDAKTVVSTISRLQKRMPLHSSPKAQEPASVIVW